MDRTEISSSVPADRAEALSDLADAMTAPSQDQLDDARDSIAWDILMGKTVGGFDLKACLDCEFNSDGYTGTVSDLAALMIGDRTLKPAEQLIATICAVHDLAYRIVAKHIPDSAVEDRAREAAEEGRMGL